MLSRLCFVVEAVVVVADEVVVARATAVTHVFESMTLRHGMLAACLMF